MADGKTDAAFKAGDRVQFKDGSNIRTGFITEIMPADATHPDGYSIMFPIEETGQNRQVRWAASDTKAAPKEDAFAFAVGDQVKVINTNTIGKVIERSGTRQGNPLPQYAVTFKDVNGQTALAWWDESILAKAA